MKSGEQIAAAINFNNKKIYVGQTENLNRRAYQHLHHLKSGTHLIQKIINMMIHM